MTDEQKAKAEQMAKSGKTIASISKDLGVAYWDVHSHVTSVHALSWIGAKKSITNRLNLLKRENDRAKREQLIDEADKCINYLYGEAKNMRGRVERARKALGD